MTSMMQRFHIVAIVLLILSSTVSAKQRVDSANDSVRQKNPTASELVLRVGFRADRVPFSFVDSRQKPAGYSIEVCQSIFEHLRKEPAYKNMTEVYVPVESTSRFEAIDKNQIDIECGTTSSTPQRREKYLFAIPHFFAASKIMVPANSSIRRYYHLRNKKVAAVKNTTGLETIKRLNDSAGLNLSIVEAATPNDALTWTYNGNVDAYIHDDVQLAVQRALSTNKTPLVILDEALSIEPIAIMMPKQSVELKKAVDRILTQMILSMHMTRLYARWFTEPMPDKNINLALPMSFLLRDSFKYPSDRLDDYSRFVAQ
jgi:ABC-type amino acid transport substrate-binding protein